MNDGKDPAQPQKERGVLGETTAFTGRIVSRAGRAAFQRARRELKRVVNPDVFFAEEFIRRYRSLKKLNLTDEQIAKTILASSRETVRMLYEHPRESTVK